MARKRIRLAQNFFRDRGLVASIVAGSSLGRDDVVYEIGPGRGIITRELAERAGRVVAIEKDPELAGRLRARFRDAVNVRVHQGDFLGYRITESRYRVFANVPFNITAAVAKRILFGPNPPGEAHLVVQREAAARFLGVPAGTLVSVLAKPWFRLEVVRAFRRTDFEPVPGVDPVLLHIARRACPLVDREDAGTYRRFVRSGFRAWKRDLATAYRRAFTHEQWRRLARSLAFPARATPSELSFEQWLGLFEFLRAGAGNSRARAGGGRRRDRTPGR